MSAIDPLTASRSTDQVLVDFRPAAEAGPIAGERTEACRSQVR